MNSWNIENTVMRTGFTKGPFTCRVFRSIIKSTVQSVKCHKIMKKALHTLLEFKDTEVDHLIRVDRTFYKYAVTHKLGSYSSRLLRRVEVGR